MSRQAATALTGFNFSLRFTRSFSADSFFRPEQMLYIFCQGGRVNDDHSLFMRSASESIIGLRLTRADRYSLI